MNQPYDLTELVKPAGQPGRFALYTRLGVYVLNYHNPKMTTRQQYKIALRALRLMRSGFGDDLSVDYAYEAETNPAIGKVALMHQFAEKEGVDFFEYLVRSNSLNRKV